MSSAFLTYQHVANLRCARKTRWTCSASVAFERRPPWRCLRNCSIVIQPVASTACAREAQTESVRTQRRGDESDGSSSPWVHDNGRRKAEFFTCLSRRPTDIRDVSQGRRPGCSCGSHRGSKHHTFNTLQRPSNRSHVPAVLRLGQLGFHLDVLDMRARFGFSERTRERYATRDIAWRTRTPRLLLCPLSVKMAYTEECVTVLALTVVGHVLPMASAQQSGATADQPQA